MGAEAQRPHAPGEEARELSVPPIAGRVWAFTDGLAAADILPARFHGLDPAAARGVLFADLDPSLAGRLAVGDVLVAGHGLGAGEGAAAAARALAAAGFVTVLAASYAGGFEEALWAAGVPAFAVDAPAAFRTGDRLRVNVEAGTVANHSSGDRQPLRGLDERARERLRALVGR